MADCVLFLGVKLGGRFIPYHKDGVITKAVLANALISDPALDGAFKLGGLALLVDVCDDGDKASGALFIRHALEFIQNKVASSDVVDLIAAVAGGLYTRLAAEIIDLKAGIVGNNGTACNVIKRFCFDV